MARIFYVHWHKDEALEAVAALRAGGHKVDYHWNSGAEAWRLIRHTPPDALVISLARLPSHGRAVAQVTIQSRRLRELPIIFVDGAPEKIAATRLKFPNALYCKQIELKRLLRKVRPFVAADPAATRRTIARNNSPAGYSGTPLPQKLGIKSNHRVALINAPPGFDHTLGDLPADVKVTSKLLDKQPHDVIVLFAKSRGELQQDFSRVSQRLDPAGGLWISWPKKASGFTTDLSEAVVREIGLGIGLVDNKVCAVDETWSGLRFVVRLKDR
jgi:CheY-like chemotaxis protein